MKWQDINKKTSALILTGVFGLIFMISQLTGVDVGYTNYPDCINGTDCYARFDVNSSYYRICFNIDDSVETPQYFKKQSRSRTLWINTSRYGFVTTEPGILTKLMMGTTKSRGIEQAPDGKWLRDIKTGDCIERKKTNYLYVKGVKDKYTDVEWKMDLFGIDPIWKAEDKTIKIKDKEYKIKDKIEYKAKNITGKDFYKLVSIETSLSYGIQVYEAVNIFDKEIPMSNFVGRILKKDKSKETNSMNITVLLNESYLNPVYKNKLIKKKCNKTDNITHEIIFYDCSYNVSVFDFNETKYRWNEYEIDKQNIQPNEKVRIKVYATWDIKLGENSRDFLPGVIIPKEYVKNKDIILEDKTNAWWNSSWDYKREVTISTPYDTFTHYPANFSINLSTEYTAGKINQTCKDIRFANSTEDGELYYDIVICDLSTSDIATFTVHLDSITTDNDTIYMYYGSNDATTTEDYFNTYHRQNENLTLDYPFKLGSGSTAWDVSGQGNNGTIYNAQWLSGGGMTFDGAGDYIDCGNNAMLSSDTQTIAFKLIDKSTSEVGYTYIIDRAPNTDNWGALGILRAISNFEVTANAPVEHQAICLWNEVYAGDFFIFSFDYPNISIYQNETLLNTLTFTTHFNDQSTVRTSIGRAGEYNGHYLNGKLSNMKIYNTSLTPTQISLLYNETKYPPTFSFGAEETSDSGAPTYSTNSTNSTLAGTSIEHRLKWEDNTALAGYIFSFDNGTGSFSNDTWISMTGVLNWSNVTKTVNSTVGTTIQWKVYANDSSDNRTVSEEYSYTTTSAPADTCSNCDGTADCYWDCSDDCNITSNINMMGYSIIINQSTGGTHTITITGNITNHSGVVGSGYNSSDMCFAIGESGGGFR